MLIILPGDVTEAIPLFGDLGVKINEKFSQLLELGENLFIKGVSIAQNTFKTAKNAIQEAWHAVNVTIDKISEILDKAIRINKIIQE